MPIGAFCSPETVPPLTVTCPAPVGTLSPMPSCQPQATSAEPCWSALASSGPTNVCGADTVCGADHDAAAARSASVFIAPATIREASGLRGGLARESRKAGEEHREHRPEH